MNNSTPLSFFEVFELSLDLSISFDHMVESTRKQEPILLEWEVLTEEDIIEDDILLLRSWELGFSKTQTYCPSVEVNWGREDLLNDRWFSTHGEEKEYKETETLVSPRIPARRFYRRTNPCSLFY